jgi:hypothetical protein
MMPEVATYPYPSSENIWIIDREISTCLAKNDLFSAVMKAEKGSRILTQTLSADKERICLSWAKRLKKHLTHSVPDYVARLMQEFIRAHPKNATSKPIWYQ